MFEVQQQLMKIIVCSDDENGYADDSILNSIMLNRVIDGGHGGTNINTTK